jgi:hypothetical protein
MGLFGNKASQKFGSSTSLVTPEGFTEGSISWKQTTLQAVDAVADSWFEDYGLIPAPDTLREGALDADPAMEINLQDYAPFYAGENTPLGIPGLEISIDDLGEQIDLTEGTLGPALISALESAGVTWRYETRFPIGYSQSVEFPNAQSLGLSQWQTFFGMPFEQMFRVFRNAAGEETCLWSSQVLAATRPFEHLASREIKDEGDELFRDEIKPEWIAKGAFTFGEWSSKFFIPQFAKRLFFMAETPFPSTVLMAHSRSLAFGGDLPKEQYPRPVLINSRQKFARGVFEENTEGFTSSGSTMPHVVELGWTFRTTKSEEIINILGVITGGLTRINTILEDGYLNYRTSEFPAPYDTVLLSAVRFDADHVHGGDAQGLSQWVPVVRLGMLLNETNVRADSAIHKNDFDELLWIAGNGAGMAVPHAINSIVWSHLISAKEWFTIDRFLDASSRMELVEESTNSLSNWGIAKYQKGLVDEAIEKFELALARADKYAEAEASFWLAKIWGERGDAQKCETYFARCQAAGGYDPGTGFAPNQATSAPKEQPALGLSKSSGGGLGGGGGLGTPSAPASAPTSTPAASGSLAAFCGQCGTKFENDTAKFCGNCGSPR